VTPVEQNLSDRQRTYLLAIFRVAQEREEEIRSMPYRPFQQRPKASEWRWLEYSEPVPDINKPASRLYEAIKKTVPIDQGTGATFAALADRGLIEVDWRERNVRSQRTPDLRMTPAGRRVARSWTGQKAYKAPSAGTLREWHWRALAKAYAAGDEGLEGEYGDYAHIGWNTWLRLRDYKAGALVEEHGLQPPYATACASPRRGGGSMSSNGGATANSTRTQRRRRQQASSSKRQYIASRTLERAPAGACCMNES
jgi:hypothetical protein